MCNEKSDQKRAEEVLYRFTSYLKDAVVSKRRDYIEREQRYRTHESLIDYQDAAVLSDIEEKVAFCATMPGSEIENERLNDALARLNSRETQILYARAVEDEDIKYLAKRLGLSMYGAYSAYRRIIVKLRKDMGGSNDAL